jgi:RHS repeat-associated protein
MVGYSSALEHSHRSRAIYRAPGEGAGVRRRRAFTRAVALALVPLMGVGPEAVAGLQQEALLARALAAAGLAQAATYEITYAYDANGNLVERTQDDRTDTYVYDAENRLIAADTQVGASTVPVAYTYDPDGIRQSKTADGSTTLYLTDANRDYAQVLEEWDSEQHDQPNGAPTVRYTYGDDLIAQTRRVNSVWPEARFYHYDGQLSTRVLTDGSPASATFGQVTDTYRYDAFGNLKTPPGPTANDYLYTGEQYDANVGFYYLRARYYDSASGRFAARDRFGGFGNNPASLHKYVYCAADPVNNADPTGMMTLAESAWVIGILATVFAISFLGTSCYGRYRGYGTRQTQAPRRIAIVNGNLGASFGLQLQMLEFKTVSGFVANAKKSGHTVTVLDNPNEAQFIQVLNSNELVLVLSHGPDDAYDNKNRPFVGMKLGGTTTNAADPSGALAAWITANELDGKVTNPTLVLVAPGCNLGKTSRLVDAVRPGFLVASKTPTNAVDVTQAFEYTARWLNGENTQVLNQWWTRSGSNNVVNPTNPDFD